MISLRLSPREWEELHYIADETGSTVTDLLLRGAGVRGHAPEKVVTCYACEGINGHHRTCPRWRTGCHTVAEGAQ